MNEDLYSFERCTILFLEYLERYNYSMDTLDGYEKDLGCFRRFITKGKEREDFSLVDVDKAKILKFMDDGRKRGNKTNTIGRRLSTLKSFYKFLVFELDYPVDVAARIRVPKVYVPIKYVLTREEVQRLLSSALQLAKPYHLLFSILYYTGSRITPIRFFKEIKCG